MSYKIIINSFLILIFTSCEKKPTACFEVESVYYVNENITPLNCSSDVVDYLWTIPSSRDYSYNANPTFKFNNDGTKKIILHTYNSTGFKTDETSASFYVGYQIIDSIIVKNCHYQVLYNQNVDSMANLKLYLNGVWAKEIYMDAHSDQLPFSYTFVPPVTVSNGTKIVLYDDRPWTVNYSGVIYEYELTEFPKENPQYHDLFSPIDKNHLELEVYWHFNN